MSESRENPAGSHELSTIDSLRKSIEQEHRFRSALFGYDRQSVQTYVDQIYTTFRNGMEELESERDRLRAENAELYARLKDQEDVSAEARAQERLRNEAELSIRESIVADLRAANQRLAEDNRRWQNEVSDLHARLDQMQANIQDADQIMSTLNARLTEMLQDKIKECDEIVTAWQAEFADTVNTVEEQVRMLN